MLPAGLLLAVSLVTVDPAHLIGSKVVAVEAGDDQDFQAAVAALEKANGKVNNDPEKHMSELADALAAMAPFASELANDQDASRLVEQASLNLARAMLRAGDRAGASEVMDELLRRSEPGSLPVQRFGPTLVEFHDARVDALEQAGTAELQFKCEVSCRVLLDRRTVTSRSGPLYLGTYDVTIESTDGSLPPEQQEVELEDPGTVLMIRYPLAGLEPTVADAGPPPIPRLAPRWAEILMAVVGAGAVGAGGALLALDGHCPGGGDPIDDAGTVCPNLYETTAAGAVSLGLGAALLSTGVVLLSVDEVQTRRGRTEHQAMLHWRMAF